MKILGSKFFGHDSAVCLIDTEKKEIFAMSTERVTRIKHDGFNISPVLNAYKKYFENEEMHICHSFNSFGSSETDGYENRVDSLYQQKMMAAYRNLFKPKYIKDFKITKEDRKKILLSQVFNIDMYKNLYSYYTNKSKFAEAKKKKYTYDENKSKFVDFIEEVVSKVNLKSKSINFYDHHKCHAYGSYYISPYYGQKALSLTVDGHGDGFFSKLYLFNNSKDGEEIAGSRAEVFKIDGHKVIASIGTIYGNFTSAMDLHRKSDPGKVEALAAFGKKDNEMYNALMDSVEIKDVSVAFNIDKLKRFYDYTYLKDKRSEMGDENFCATIQTWLEDIIVKYLDIVSEKYNIDTLCLSGGVSANIIMSLNIYERTKFKNIYVMPPMGDDGTALGSAILKGLEEGADLSWLRDKYMPYYGDKIDVTDIDKQIRKYEDKVKYEYLGDEWYKDAAKSIGNNKIIALVNGYMEFGPRALGNRSIVANPIDQGTRDKINSTVKRRPSYQPFCPSILELERERLFENSFNHKHMAIAFRIKEEFRTKIPSGVHVDGTVRPQFVEEEDNPDYFKLIKEFKEISGYGVVIDTSFNLHGRTIVRTFDDAIVDFIDCKIDILYLEKYKITLK